MIISYYLDNDLIFEIKNKDIVNFISKVTLSTILILLINNATVFAKPIIRKYVDDGTIFLIEKMIELFYRDSFGEDCVDYWFNLPIKTIKSVNKILK